MARPTSLSLTQARRLALAAQGFADRAHATPTMRTLERTVGRTGVLQVDSVNVLARAHLMPLYSRMGPYDTDLLRRAAETEPRRLVEYWAHVQALMPVELWPVLAFRRAQYLRERGKWWNESTDEVADRVLAAVAARGPVTARDLEAEFRTGPRSRENWGWNWSEARRTLDFLYSAGLVAVAGRNRQFELRYDLPERVLPAHVLATPDLSPADGARELVRRAARSHGVGTAQDLADYYRMRTRPRAGAEPDAGTAIAELVEAGELEPVTVEGWKRPAFRYVGATLPRRIEAATVLSPFDPLCWERSRTQALFDFFYRIEIYVPAAHRVHGYYVLPFLLGEHLVARVDLKADRAAGRLLVHGAWAQPHAPSHTAEALAVDLRRLASWLGLDDIAVTPHGDLGKALAAAVLVHA